MNSVVFRNARRDETRAADRVRATTRRCSGRRRSESSPATCDQADAARPSRWARAVAPCWTRHATTARAARRRQSHRADLPRRAPRPPRTERAPRPRDTVADTARSRRSPPPSTPAWACHWPTAVYSTRPTTRAAWCCAPTLPHTPPALQSYAYNRCAHFFNFQKKTLTKSIDLSKITRLVRCVDQRWNEAHVADCDAHWTLHFSQTTCFDWKQKGN